MDSTIKWILVVLTLFAVLASATLMAYPGSNEAGEIFDCSRAILPLLVGIALGFHFGRISR